MHIGGNAGLDRRNNAVYNSVKSFAPDGKLSKNVSKTKAPLKKESIYKALVELVGDANKATSMTEHIINSRPDVQRINLKRTQIRGKKD